MTDSYYHAGTSFPDGTVLWGASTRRSKEVAEREARRLAHWYGGKPIVESWDRSHGTKPQDADCVRKCWEVQP